MLEMARIRLHGFSEREVNQARASMMSDVESAYIERDQDYSQVGSNLPPRHWSGLDHTFMAGFQGLMCLCLLLLSHTAWM